MWFIRAPLTLLACSQQATQVPEAPERFVVSLEDAAALNHISVFMTGAGELTYCYTKPSELSGC